MRDINDIQIEIAETSDRLYGRVDRLGHSVSAQIGSFSVLNQVRSRPLLALGVAVASGVVLGRTLTRSASSRQKVVSDVVAPLAMAVLSQYLASKSRPVR